MTTSIPTKYDDTIDSRDVIAAIEYYEEFYDDMSEDDKAALDALKELSDEGESFDDWEYGCTLIRDSYFREYAMDLAEEIGAIDSNAAWPNTCIDWDQAARELKMDYSSIGLAGATYLIR